MKELNKYMATKDTMWIHISMTQSSHSHEKIHSGAMICQNIAMDQYKVELCDGIHMNTISNMVTILESSKYSYNIHRNLG
jgi:hypothetical protein